MCYNGACGLTKERIHGCRDFIFRHEPKLKRPENMGRVYRCKHVIAARNYVRDMTLDSVIDMFLKEDKNIPDHLQV